MVIALRGALDPARVGLTAAEAATIRTALGREPTAVELRCLGVLWSEHCAYKHSRTVLRRLPAAGTRVLQGPGENAGVVAVAGGWALVVKMESHNHPSAVDPYNGAATGVGGIIRDVLAMGARPVALLDALRFGPPGDPRSRRLLAGVVAGIAGYGNSIGVPTVGGDLAVDPAYRDNPLVNVACLGLVRADGVARARAAPGQVFLYAGARTGRDGVGGAAFASEELDERSEREDRAAVQIGDPFAGKCLVEATLAALATGRVRGVQDMGAGGLACAAVEMAARGGCGAVLDLDRVPLREGGLAPEEILLSESQERMLIACASEDAPALAAHYERWGLAAAVVGRATADGRFRARFQGAMVADLPVGLLTGAPERHVVPRQPPVVPSPPVPPIDPAALLLRLLAAPELADRRVIFEQYDHMVQVRTVVPPGADAAVLRLPEVPPLGVALTVDGHGRWCALDPYAGAAATVLEAAANLACVGAEPLAVTDCLNFPSPERPEVAWAFAQAVEGIADACRALDVPVVGGNVSFYNEGPRGPILPTPMVAMVGLLPDVAQLAATPGAGADPPVLVLLGDGEVTLAGSLCAREAGVRSGGAFPRPAVGQAVRTLEVVRRAVREGLVALAHDVSDGGLLPALAEVCLTLHRGARVALGALPPEAGPSGAAAGWPLTLFGEGGTRVLCVLLGSRLAALEGLAASLQVPVHALGVVDGDTLTVAVDGRPAVHLPLAVLRRAASTLAEVLA
jgi:phosphoribosylformylglycinamidine synthase